MKFEKNTELDQANLRLIVATCAILYVVLIVAADRKLTQ